MRIALVASLVCLTALAGCSDDPKSQTVEEVEEVRATATTGGIRGVVVDQRIVPIEGATVKVLNTGLEMRTDVSGAFLFEELAPGDHFVEASHPLYDRVQQSTTVKAGVRDPPVLKLQLSRQIEAEPYLVTEKFQGFITCSINLVVILSEECGEGVGVPGLGRVGQNPNNNAQIDFFVQGPHVRSLVIEQVWEPSTSLGVPGAQSGAFYTVVATEWACEPVCSGNRMGTADSPSPLYIHINEETLEQQELTAETVISSFTWASAEETGVLLEQEFELFVTASYFLPLPEAWSFVNGDPNPF